MTRKPLTGKSVLVTSPGKDGELFQCLKKLGASVIWRPTFAIKGKDFKLSRVKTWDFLVFSSRNGVKYFLKGCAKLGIDVKTWKATICAIGIKTAAEISSRGLSARIVPKRYTSQDLARALARVVKRGSRILYPGGDLRNNNIKKLAMSKGALLRQVDVYSLIHKKLSTSLNDVDIIVFTSALQTRIAAKYLDLTGKKLICIGPETAAALKAMGLHPHIVADEHTYSGLIREIRLMARRNLLN
jgi:uroporphyrinogen-III synthase